MKKLIRLEETRAVRPRLAAWAVAAVAVVAATVAGITAGQGNAAPAIEADKASHLHKKAEFKQPKLKHGVLTDQGHRGKRQDRASPAGRRARHPPGRRR